jgi:hypothetical protein
MLDLPSREAPIAGAPASRSPRPAPQSRTVRPGPGHAAPGACRRATGRDDLGGLLQRVVKERVAVSALSNIMDEHGLHKWYTDNWPVNVKRIANEIAAKPGTTKRNVAKGLRGHPEIAPLLLPQRLTLYDLHGGGRDSYVDPALQKVYAAYLRCAFFHATPVPDKIRESGLDPNWGGTETGFAKTRSLAGEIDDNVAGAKNKSYITRSYAEAKQYAKDGGDKTIVRILVPASQRAKLKVDPDSQKGVYTEEKLLGVDLPDRRLGFYAKLYLRQELESEDSETYDRMEELYEQLVELRAFLPGAGAPPGAGAADSTCFFSDLSSVILRQ